jgi:hypothetical protein
LDWPWESCVTMQGEGWFWNGGNNLKSFESCLKLLISSAVGDGNLLLDFGLNGLGEIDPQIKARYLAMGEWLRQYGHTIYGSRGGPYKPGLWGGSTRVGNTIYLHVTEKWPEGILRLPPLPAPIVAAKSLVGGKVSFSQTDDVLTVKLDPKYHHSVDTIIALELSQSANELETIAALSSPPLNLDPEVIASSSKSGGTRAPEAPFPSRYEYVHQAKYFGEDGKEIGHEEPSAAVKKSKPWLKLSRDHIWRFWMADPADKQPVLTMDMGNPIAFSRIHFLEKFNRIEAYQVEALVDGVWETLFSGQELGMLAYRLPKSVTAQQVRIIVEKWSSDMPTEGPGIRLFDLYK